MEQLKELMALKESDSEIQYTSISDIKELNLTKVSSQTLKFINSAASDDESRISLNGILLQDNYMVATDGRRMHVYIGGAFVYTTFGIAKTHVDKTSATCKFYDAEFPRFKRVIPEVPNNTEILTYYKCHGILNFMYKLSRKGFVFCDDYIKDLVKYCISWKVYYTDNAETACIFESLYKNLPVVYAVIMPMKVS